MWEEISILRLIYIFQGIEIWLQALNIVPNPVEDVVKPVNVSGVSAKLGTTWDREIRQSSVEVLVINFGAYDVQDIGQTGIEYPLPQACHFRRINA